MSKITLDVASIMAMGAAGAIASTSLDADSVEGLSSHRDWTIPSSIEAIPQAHVGEPKLTALQATGSGASLEVAIRPEVRWDSGAAKRFALLVERRALEQITPNQEFEFKELVQARRAVISPRTGEEVIRQYEADRLAEELINNLQRYVRFHNRTKSGEKTSGKEKGKVH